jgi:hypothetical protein
MTEPLLSSILDGTASQTSEDDFQKDNCSHQESGKEYRNSAEKNKKQRKRSTPEKSEKNNQKKIKKIVPVKKKDSKYSRELTSFSSGESAAAVDHNKLLSGLLNSVEQNAILVKTFIENKKNESQSH